MKVTIPLDLLLVMIQTAAEPCKACGHYLKEHHFPEIELILTTSEPKCTATKCKECDCKYYI